MLVALRPYVVLSPPMSQKRLKRTDSSTLGIERVADKRWGRGPVQSKIKVLKKHLQQVDDDDDFDDK